MSSAGLVRYFDSESSQSVFVTPETTLATAMLFGTAITLLNVLF
jgi:preprotein translocase subunit Sec61beta